MTSRPNLRKQGYDSALHKRQVDDDVRPFLELVMSLPEGLTSPPRADVPRRARSNMALASLESAKLSRPRAAGPLLWQPGEPFARAALEGQGRPRRPVEGLKGFLVDELDEFGHGFETPGMDPVAVARQGLRAFAARLVGPKRLECRRVGRWFAGLLDPATATPRRIDWKSHLLDAASGTVRLMGTFQAKTRPQSSQGPCRPWHPASKKETETQFAKDATFCPARSLLPQPGNVLALTSIGGSRTASNHLLGRSCLSTFVCGFTKTGLETSPAHGPQGGPSANGPGRGPPPRRVPCAPPPPCEA